MMPSRFKPDSVRKDSQTSSKYSYGFWLIVLSCMLVSCFPSAQPQQLQATLLNTADQIEVSPAITSEVDTPSSAVTTTPEPARTIVPSTQKPACLETPGVIEILSIQDTRLFRPIPARIYLPPCYESDADKNYPTLYLLHGLQSTDDQWDQLGVDETADQLISNGTLPPFIIVMPWHRTGIDLVTAVPEVLVPYIERNYKALPDRTYRAIGGLSKGGGQALEIGLKYPKIFSAVGMHSPAVPYLNSVILDWAREIPQGSLPAVWIDIGMRDSLFPTAQLLIDDLQANAIPITLQLDEGDHEAAYWESHLEGYLRWYASNWKRASLKDTLK